jgi:acetyltransferase-like isoleucine patch superfamily enzyme
MKMKKHKALGIRLLHKICNFMKRGIESVYSKYRYVNFAANADIHSSVKILSNAVALNPNQQTSLINIEKNSVIGCELFVFAHAGRISIGENCYIGEGSRIWSSSAINIGNRVYISFNVNIHDTNSHSIDAYLRSQHFLEIMTSGHSKENRFDIKSCPIVIEDDVWIGFNSTILKGVKIGKGSIVGACSVVTKDVPANVLVVGNPAVIIKTL